MSERLSDDELKRLLDEATPGEWELHGSDNATPHILHDNVGHHGGPTIDDRDSVVCTMPAEITQKYNSWANARLIVYVPALVDEVIELREKVAAQKRTRTGAEETYLAHLEPIPTEDGDDDD